MVTSPAQTPASAPMQHYNDMARISNPWEHWLPLAIIGVPGDSAATNDPQTWTKIAVIEVSPNTEFRVGFIYDGALHLLTDVIHAAKYIGLKVGNANAHFMIVPVNPSLPFSYIHAATTTFGDPAYPGLVVY